ncbi:MAG: hypothetical protein FWF12_05655 [Betaproteobacteria bacterium]|nr:hypothetical protein [Betaproteobacteria bacterium]
MDKRPILAIALLSVLSLPIGGCVSDLGGNDYSRVEARRVMTVRFAIVDSVRPVKMEGTRTPLGSMAGGVAGGAIGNSFGGSGTTSSLVGTVIGFVAGSLGGAALEEAATSKQGVEITVRLEGAGGYLAIVQADGGENFEPGERVRLIGDAQATRVTR